jgi:hypothetical protein
VEPTNPCATNTLEGTQSFRQPIFSRISVASQGTNSGKSTVGTSLGSRIQLSISCRSGSSPNFKMVGVDPTIRLPKFHGETS